ASIYDTVKTDMIGKGMSVDVAGKTAAHFANRFGGGISREELSAMANKISNIMLFFKSFTGTNLGLYLDAIRGLPKSTRGFIERNAAELESRTANNYVRKRAAMTMLKDVAFLYGITALAQDGIKRLKGEKSWPQIFQGYADRFDKYFHKAKENPLEIL